MDHKEAEASVDSKCVPTFCCPGIFYETETRNLLTQSVHPTSDDRRPRGFTLPWDESTYDDRKICNKQVKLVLDLCGNSTSDETSARLLGSNSVAVSISRRFTGAFPGPFGVPRIAPRNYRLLLSLAKKGARPLCRRRRRRRKLARNYRLPDLVHPDIPGTPS